MDITGLPDQSLSSDLIRGLGNDKERYDLIISGDKYLKKLQKYHEIRIIRFADLLHTPEEK